MRKGKMIFTLAAMALCLGMFSTDVKAAPKTMADGTVFDAEFYAATYPDVVAAFGTDEALLYQHYVTNGKAEGRMACAIAFDPVYYAERYPDVKAAFGDNAELLYQHYIMFGMAEGREGVEPETEEKGTGTENTENQATSPNMTYQAEKFGYRVGDSVRLISKQDEIFIMNYLGQDEWSDQYGAIWTSYLHRDGKLHWRIFIA